MLDPIKSLIDQQKIDQVLKKSSPNKAEAKILQTALYELGFGEELKWNSSQPDGIFGNNTAIAVKAFASKVGIQTTGETVSADVASAIIEKHKTVQDLRALKQAADGISIGKVKANKSLAKAVQRLLNAQGFGNEMNFSQHGADGIFGTGSKKALAAFSQREGIDQNGSDSLDSFATKMLEKYVPFLGSGWADVTAIAGAANKRVKRGSGQYFKLYPVSKRGFKQISKTRKKPDAEGGKLYTYSFKPVSKEIPGESLKKNFYKVEKHNAQKNQILSFTFKKDPKEDQEKVRIVLHHTAGQALGDLKTLTKEGNKISTPYILGRDGSIYEIFNPQDWAWHLGNGAKGGNTKQSSRSIGIEISNIGPLKERGGQLFFGEKFKNLYCSLEDTEAYTKLEQPYLGLQYYATFTDIQYEALIILIRTLTQEYGIKRQFLPTDPDLEKKGEWMKIERYKTFANHEQGAAFEGICSHINYRHRNKEGNINKWDLGPAFDWDKVIKGVLAENFEPVHKHELEKEVKGEFKPKSRSRSRSRNKPTDILQPIYGDQDTSIFGPDGPEVDI